MAIDKIVIKGAKAHNLKNVDLTLPRDKLIVFTGLSGSGKSTLAFDTIYADGQRRYVESLSSYARMFLGQMDKPDVESIEGLSPAISIDQKTTSRNPRSTVGTVTEIYDYLRLMFARIGVPHCPVCGREIRQQTVDQIVDQVLALPSGKRIQVLAPMHRQACGTDNLNKVLQAALNPKSPQRPELTNAAQTFRLGDKVIQTKNNYTKQVFNGDIGFVMAIEPGRMTVHFGDELEVDYESGEFGELSLAYALTVHKSQGSEYPVVILPLVRSHTIMMQRNLLYTAVTRAKREVILLGSKAALNTAVANNRTSKRYTLLAERLHYGFER